jgi:hypothetical protein
VAYGERILRQVGETAFTPESDALGAPGRYVLRLEGLDEGQPSMHRQGTSTDLVTRRGNISGKENI